MTWTSRNRARNIAELSLAYSLQPNAHILAEVVNELKRGLEGAFFFLCMILQADF